MNSSTSKSVLLAGLMVFVGVTAGFAQVSLVTDRGSLGGVDFIDWAGLGAEFTIVPSGSTIDSNLGLTATITMPSGAFSRLDQGSGWAGNFAPGDALLFTNSNAGPMVISFDAPVEAAGAQIQRNTFGSFTATIEAYDGSNNLLGSFDVAGDSTSAGDNAAIFVGVQATSAEIARIEYSVDSVTEDFSINQLDIGTAGVPTMNQVALVLLLLLLACVSVMTLRRRRSD